MTNGWADARAEMRREGWRLHGYDDWIAPTGILYRSVVLAWTIFRIYRHRGAKHG